MSNGKYLFILRGLIETALGVVRANGHSMWKEGNLANVYLSIESEYTVALESKLTLFKIR